MNLNSSHDEKTEIAIFAAGCFWCIQHAFDHTPGVISTIVGYTGGHTPNPTYEDVSTGKTGYIESIEVTFDPKKVSYEQLLDLYWRNVDPTRDDGQFCDIGSQYQPVIFYSSDIQRKQAEASKSALKDKIKPILVAILPAQPFHSAEDYHQKYYSQNPIRYQCYHDGCGRVAKLKKLWSDLSDSFDGKKLVLSDKEWKEKLTPDQYRVLRKEGTEAPFQNEYADYKQKGIYQCAGCALPLFSSEAKYDSGTGWPSFSAPISSKNVTIRSNFNPFTSGKECVCSRCEGHLGHIFNDGPLPSGTRYCMNSAALHFTTL